MSNKKRLRGKRGFTLIELIVIIAVLGILVLLAAPRLLNTTDKAKLAHITNDIKVAEGKLLEIQINDGNLSEIVTPVDFQSLVSGDFDVYNKQGKINVDDLVYEDNYSLLNDDFKTLEVRSKLSGHFYTSEGGNIYYAEESRGSTNANDGKDDVIENYESLIDYILPTYADSGLNIDYTGVEYPNAINYQYPHVGDNLKVISIEGKDYEVSSFDIVAEEDEEDFPDYEFPEGFLLESSRQFEYDPNEFDYFYIPEVVAVDMLYREPLPDDYEMSEPILTVHGVEYVRIEKAN